ncbi:hypothetical protein PFISCL1PPCAC_4098, partial [Pristionchus fissidentatus]
VPPLFFLLSLLSVEATDGKDDYMKLKPCRNCMLPKIFSPAWMGVDVVKLTSRPCKWIECEGNLELYVNGKNYHMNKLMCYNGVFRSVQDMH